MIVELKEIKFAISLHLHHLKSFKKECELKETITTNIETRKSEKRQRRRRKTVADSFGNRGEHSPQFAVKRD